MDEWGWWFPAAEAEADEIESRCWRAENSCLTGLMMDAAEVWAKAVLFWSSSSWGVLGAKAVRARDTDGGNKILSSCIAQGQE